MFGLTIFNYCQTSVCSDVLVFPPRYFTCSGHELPLYSAEVHKYNSEFLWKRLAGALLGYISGTPANLSCDLLDMTLGCSSFESRGTFDLLESRFGMISKYFSKAWICEDLS